MQSSTMKVEFLHSILKDDKSYLWYRMRTIVILASTICRIAMLSLLRKATFASLEVCKIRISTKMPKLKGLKLMEEHASQVAKALLHKKGRSVLLVIYHAQVSFLACLEFS